MSFSACRIVSIFNQAGGVAKTTLTMNLGYHLSQHGERVLLVDMDPQASLTTFMGLEPYDLEKTIADSLLKDAPLPIHSALHSMDLIPANITLSGAEFQLASAIAREWKLKRALSTVVDTYSFILIDCPPTLGILSILSLVAATHVLISIQNPSNFGFACDCRHNVSQIFNFGLPRGAQSSATGGVGVFHGHTLETLRKMYEWCSGAEKTRPI